MNYWWVNHKQTFGQENAGGFIWSPQRKSNGAFNQSYLNLTLTQANDIVFSYAFGQIRSVGLITEPHQVVDRPVELGEAGKQWNPQGWLVKVAWTNVINPLLPKNHLPTIVPLLHKVNSPIQTNGNGNQHIYLAGISEELAMALLDIIERQNPGVMAQLQETNDGISEETEAKNVLSSSLVTSTQKSQIIQARVGQGLFRQRVQAIEKSCRLTGVSDGRFLTASHVKPWRDSTNAERLDGNNGLLLAPHVDKLFDQGWVSFSDEGEVLLAPDESIGTLMKLWNLNYAKNVGSFSKEQRAYLAYHRTHRFKASAL